MPVLPSIQYGDLKGNHTISGTAEPNARVLLFNPASGRHVKSVDADASGNFDFGVLDSTVPLQIRIASSNDFTCESTSSTIKPAPSLDTRLGKCIIGVQNMYNLNQSGYQWASTPKAVFVDQGGSGSGAAMEITLASQGQTYWDGYGYQPFDRGNDPIGNPITTGNPILNWSMTDFGSNYTNPICYIVGTRVNVNFNYVTESYQSEFVSVPLSVYTSGSAGILQNTNDFLTNIINRWSSSNTWGSYSGQNNTGQRLLVQVPGYSNIEYNVGCTTEDSTQPGPALQEKLAQVWMEGWSPNAEATLMGANYSLYLKLIHGHSGDTLGMATNKVTGQAANNLDNSALVAMNNGVILYEELAYLKGWIATEVQVKAMVNRYTAGWASYVAANSGIFNNYVYKPLLTWITDFALVAHNINDAFRRWEPNSNASQYFGLGPSFAKEWQDAAVQSVGAFDAANDRGIQRVRAILTKLGNHYGVDFINGITTTDNTGTYRWDFRGNTLLKVQL